MDDLCYEIRYQRYSRNQRSLATGTIGDPDALASAGQRRFNALLRRGKDALYAELSVKPGQSVDLRLVEVDVDNRLDTTLRRASWTR